MDDVRTGLSYGDALLVPKRSPVDSRSAVDLSTRIAPGLALDRPVLSAAMDTVTGPELAVALDAAGGLGVLHRFATVDEQAAWAREVTDRGACVAGAVGIAEDSLDRAEALLEAGVDAVVVDVAHGHMEACLDAVAAIRSAFDPVVVAGNVATPEGVRDLAAAGADCVKVGVGPGSHCTTRRVAGAGVPQLTAVADCADAAADHGVTTVADGGIRSSGDAAKALVAGADAVMLGSLFAGTAEAPGAVVEVDGARYKRSRGMATTAAAEDRSDKESEVNADEGVEALTPYKGPLGDLVEEFAAGVRSGLSYCGAHTLAEARENGEFVRAAASAREREGAHFDQEWEDPGAGRARALEASPSSREEGSE
ncbi:MAG: guanosine monophosphate reductase [Haloferacaceae archaeon]